jgi:diphosphomevalonate decarboxylase
VPFNPSISMTLSACVSRCTVEHRPEDAGDELLVQADSGSLIPASPAFAAPVLRQLERLRQRCAVGGSFRVATGNSFPTGAGIASSASGFAALTLATLATLDRDVSPEEASILARASGSGSAARSVFGGFVEWPGGDDDEGAARQLADETHWGLSDVVAVTSSAPKEVSSREGHRRAPASPRFEPRQRQLAARLEATRQAIAERSLGLLGPVLEDEAVDLHLIAMSSDPPIFYWNAGTIEVLRRVRSLRNEGLDAWFTIDAGPNVHVICRSEDESTVRDALGAMAAVEQVIADRVGGGPQESDEHLF